MASVHHTIQCSGDSGSGEGASSACGRRRWRRSSAAAMRRPGGGHGGHQRTRQQQAAAARRQRHDGSDTLTEAIDRGRGGARRSLSESNNNNDLTQNPDMASVRPCLSTHAKTPPPTRTCNLCMIDTYAKKYPSPAQQHSLSLSLPLSRRTMSRRQPKLPNTRCRSPSSRSYGVVRIQSAHAAARQPLPPRLSALCGTSATGVAQLLAQPSRSSDQHDDRVTAVPRSRNQPPWKHFAKSKPSPHSAEEAPPAPPPRCVADARDERGAMPA